MVSLGVHGIVWPLVVIVEVDGVVETIDHIGVDELGVAMVALRLTTAAVVPARVAMLVEVGWVFFPSSGLDRVVLEVPVEVDGGYRGGARALRSRRVPRRRGREETIVWVASVHIAVRVGGVVAGAIGRVGRGIKAVAVSDGCHRARKRR